MAVVYALLPDGGFVAGETESGLTMYAAAHSINASAANTRPRKIAEAMIHGCLGGPQPGDKDNWRRLSFMGVHPPGPRDYFLGVVSAGAVLYYTPSGASFKWVCQPLRLREVVGILKGWAEDNPRVDILEFQSRMVIEVYQRQGQSMELVLYLSTPMSGRSRDRILSLLRHVLGEKHA